MKRTWLAIILTLALAWPLTACVDALSSIGLRSNTNERGNPINEDNIGRIVRGQTTVTDLAGLFGAPNKTEEMGKNNRLYIYEHCRSSSSGVSGYGLGSSGSSEKCNRLTITVDSQTEVVRTYNWQKVF